MEYNYNQCPECGYTSNKRPDVCPSCGHDLAAYRRKLMVKQEEDAKKAQEEAAYAEKDKKYKAAVALFGANQFEKARNQFLELGDFKESEKYAEKSFKAMFDDTVKVFESDAFFKIIYVSGTQKRTDNYDTELKECAKNYDAKNIDAFIKLFDFFRGAYSSKEYIAACNFGKTEYARMEKLMAKDAHNLDIKKRYEEAIAAYKAKEYIKSFGLFDQCEGYESSVEYAEKARHACYNQAVIAYEKEQYDIAINLFSALDKYDRSKEYLANAEKKCYALAMSFLERECIDEVKRLLEKLPSTAVKLRSDITAALDKTQTKIWREKAKKRAKEEKARSIRNTIIFCCVVLLLVFAIFGVPRIVKSIRYSADNIVISIEDKVKETGYENVTNAFKIKIQNNGSVEILEINGEMNIYNADGELLVRTNCCIRDTIKPNKDSTLILTVNPSRTDDADEFYCASYDDLSVTFEFTTVSYGNDKVIEYNTEAVTILPLKVGSDGVSVTKAKYEKALSLFNQQNYSEALPLFEELGKYKDSYERYEECRSTIAANDYEAQYSEAMSLLAEEKYGKAINKLKEIENYKDSLEKIDEIKAIAASKADDLAAVGDYEKAAAILLEIGYDMAYNSMYRAYDYASKGDLVQAVAHGLKVVFIPEGTEIIPDNYFRNDEGRYKIEKVILPDSIKSIGNAAFRNCSHLTEINLPNGLVTIGANTFGDCRSLTSITLPDSVLSIGDSAFSGCSTLRTVKLPATLQTIGKSAFSGCVSMTSITLPSTLILLGENAFNGCVSLLSVTVPGSIKTVSESAFFGCSKLVSATLSEGVETIGSSAFRGCSMLTSVTLPSSLVEIGTDAFRECTGLSQITIPKNVKTIRPNAFAYCSALSSATFESTTGWTRNSRAVTVTDPLQNAEMLTEITTSTWGTWSRSDSE